MSRSSVLIPILAAMMLLGPAVAAAAPRATVHGADPAQCPARATGSDSGETGEASGETSDRPAPGTGLRSRAPAPPGMDRHWHRFLPGMFR